MKKYLPWAAIVALLVGLALLPGPKAGAAVPSNLTYSVAQNSTGTGLVVAWTLTNTAETSVAYFIYGCVFSPADCSADFGNGNNQLTLAPGAQATFHQDYPCGTTTGDIDIAAPYPPPGFDLPGTFTTDAQCVPPTTTTLPTVPTTVPPVVPPVAPPAPPAAAPPVAPTPISAPPAAVQPPLAFTGAPVLPEIGVALALILAGVLCLRRSRRVA